MENPWFEVNQVRCLSQTKHHPIKLEFQLDYILKILSD